MPGTDNLTLEIIYFTDENFYDLLLVVLILEYKLFEWWEGVGVIEKQTLVLLYVNPCQISCRRSNNSTFDINYQQKSDLPNKETTQKGIFDIRSHL